MNCDLSAMRRLIHSPHAPELLRSRVVPRAAVSARQSRAIAAGQLQLPRVRTELARHSFFFAPHALGTAGFQGLTAYQNLVVLGFQGLAA